MSTDALLNNAFFIPLAPLAAFGAILFFRNRLGFQGVWLGVLAMAYAFIHSLLIAVGIFNGSVVLPREGLQGRFFEWMFTWFSVGSFDFRLGLLLDGLSATMLVVVTLVSLLVQIYSIAYMKGHVRYGRYFAYINLFTFSMLLLVVASELVQFFVGWELVGLSSYLLISFDFERAAAADAGRKAFLTTRVGDLGMYAGLLIVFNYLGTFNIPMLQQSVAMGGHASWVLTAVPILLFLGAIGKSAQVPLHFWLPDAMEGPTPASALIHAATMVAAGVYMVARLFFLYEASPTAMDTVAWVGAITAVVAALMGLSTNDLKRVLAFSTISQLGFMMAALGCGGYAAGMFHLTTHAAFKALLFLCAGSVIHAMHTNDMTKMGGLKAQMPVTAATYLTATLAIAGCPPLAGFFSKEEVLAAALHHEPVIFAILSFAAFLTSFYMFRTWFMTFTGLPRERERSLHAHESPATMTVPLLVLAVLSVVLGIGLWYQGNLARLVSWGAPIEHHQGDVVLFTSLFVFVLGAALAGLIYMPRPARYSGLAPLTAALAKLYRDLLDRGPVTAFSKVGTVFSGISAMIDSRIIDRALVDGNAVAVSRLGAGLRRLQTGFAQTYLFWVLIGLGGLMAWVAQHFR